MSGYGAWLEAPYVDKAAEDITHEMFQESAEYEMALADWALEQDPETLAEDAHDWDDVFQRTPEYADAFGTYYTGPEDDG